MCGVDPWQHQRWVRVTINKSSITSNPTPQVQIHYHNHCHFWTRKIIHVYSVVCTVCACYDKKLPDMYTCFKNFQIIGPNWLCYSWKVNKSFLLMYITFGFHTCIYACTLYQNHQKWLTIQINPFFQIFWNHTSRCDLMSVM